MHERCRQVRSRRRKYASHYHVTPFISSVFRNALACSATAPHTQTHTPFGALHLPHLAVAKYTRVIPKNSLIFPHTTLPDFIPYCHTCQASKLIFPPHRPSPSYPPPSIPSTHTPFHTLSLPFHTNNFFLPPFRPIFAPYRFFGEGLQGS